MHMYHTHTQSYMYASIQNDLFYDIVYFITDPLSPYSHIFSVSILALKTVCKTTAIFAVVVSEACERNSNGLCNVMTFSFRFSQSLQLSNVLLAISGVPV